MLKKFDYKNYEIDCCRAKSLALLVLTLVFAFFAFLWEKNNFAIVFIILTTAADLLILMAVFYNNAHFIILIYSFVVFLFLKTQSFNLLSLSDYCEFVFEGFCQNNLYPFPFTGFFLFNGGQLISFFINYLMGEGFCFSFYYSVISYIINWFFTAWAFVYIMFAAVSPFFAISIVLFLPLISAVVVGLFGGKLGFKYSCYLTSGSVGLGSLGAIYMWLIFPALFNYFNQTFVEAFSERRDHYYNLYANAVAIKEKIANDAEFSNTWYMNNHKNSLDIALEHFKSDYVFSNLICNFFDRYAPFAKLKTANDSEIVVNFGSIFKFYTVEADWLFKFDNLSLSAAFVVLCISFLVHLFSYDYMFNDPHGVRFFSYLSMFTFFMVMLVFSANMVVFYIAWEGVGFCSFLLISFWFTRAQANKAAMKALLVNKIGDVFLLMAAAQAFNLCGSLDFSIIFSLAPITGQSIALNFLNLKGIDILCLFLLTAALVKSAQLFFHIWLADAMEGPTPVSALLHAATMVTAGVFLIVRFSFVFEYSNLALLLMICFGVATAILSSLVGLFQYDIKKIIAYSTCSQIGLMFIACGLSGYNLALFHFFNHAFFKALLFLSAGILIHALKNEQDIRKMGGLKNIFPFTYTVFLIGSLSLVGFPFFSGYFSKDAIIALAYAKYFFNGSHFILYILILLSVFLTCFYSFKLIFHVFLLNKTNISKHLHVSGVKERLNFFIIFPLTVLGILSIVSGAVFKDYFVGSGSNFFLGASVFSLCEELKYFMFFKEEKILTLFILFISYLTCIIWSKFFATRNSVVMSERNNWYNYILRAVFIFFNKKMFFDDLYNLFISSRIFKFSYDLFLKLDKGVLEYFGPTGIYSVLKKLSFNMKLRFNSGSLGFLLKFMLMGVVVILIIALI